MVQAGEGGAERIGEFSSKRGEFTFVIAKRLEEALFQVLEAGFC